jgi:hypothetical protein
MTHYHIAPVVVTPHDPNNCEHQFKSQVQIQPSQTNDGHVQLNLCSTKPWTDSKEYSPVHYINAKVQGSYLLYFPLVQIFQSPVI